MSSPADWGAIPVTSPQDWGAVPVVSPPAATAPLPVERPGIMARIGRGAEDIYQGLAQRMLQGIDVLPKERPSVDELRAYAGPEDQNLSDEDLRKKFEQQSLSKNYTEGVNQDLALYNKGREGQGWDWARMAGAGLATAPVALLGAPAGATSLGARVLARAKLGAIGGAAAGGAQFAPSGKLSDTAVNTAIGAGTGAVAAPVLGAAGDKALAAARWLGGRIAGLRAPALTEPDFVQAVPESAGVTPAQRADLLAEAQQQLRSTGQMDAPALSRKANLLAQGATPTTAMVTRNPADWTLERNLQKLSQSPDPQLSTVGQEITGVYQANDRALAAKLAERSQGLPAATPEAHGMTVMQGINDLADATQKDVSSLYDQVRATKGERLASDARNLHSTLEELKDSPAADPVTQAATRRLTRLGMYDKEGNLTDKTLTVKEAEGLRQFINQQPNVFGKRQIVNAIDQDVLGGAGEDAFAGARSAASERFQMLGNPAAQKALSTLGELSQGKTAQNFIKSQVISAADQDVGSLVDTIAKIPNETQRTQTQNALKAGVLQYLQEQAVNPNSGKFSGSALNTAIRQVGEGKLTKILGTDEFGKLKDLSRAALDATYEPPYSAVNYSNTTPTLLSLIRGTRTIPVIGPNLLSDTAEEIAARAGYRSQLRGALAARAPGPTPAVSPAVEGIARLLPRAAPAVAGAVNPMLNQRRKATNEGRQ